MGARKKTGRKAGRKAGGADGRNGHDLFFQTAVRDPGICGAMLGLAVPGDELALFDLSTLRAEPTMAAGSDLRESRADAAVSVRFKGSDAKARIVFLLERKSWRDPLVLMQMLRYQVDIGSAEVRAKGEPTPVWPVLVHQGKKPWDDPPSTFRTCRSKGFRPGPAKPCGAASWTSPAPSWTSSASTPGPARSTGPPRWS